MKRRVVQPPPPTDDDWSGWGHYKWDAATDVTRLVERCPDRHGPHGTCEFGHHAYHLSPRRLAEMRLRLGIDIGVVVDR